MISMNTVLVELLFICFPFTSLLFATARKRSFAGSVHVVRNKLCCDANNAVGHVRLSKQRTLGWTG